MLEKKGANQKRHYLNRRAAHKFQVGDLVLLKKHQADKIDLKWEPNYRVVKLPSSWSAVVENQTSGRMKRCNVGDLKHKHPSEDWKLKPSPIGRAARFFNHPDNIPEGDFKPDGETKTTPTQDLKGIADKRFSLRRAIKAPKKLDL